jgi:hypothetical protein
LNSFFLVPRFDAPSLGTYRIERHKSRRTTAPITDIKNPAG